jgi:hypothetical protein
VSEEPQGTGADGEPDEPLGENDLAAMAARMQQLQAMSQAWRPACVSCLNEHKLAIIALQHRLQSTGIAPGSPEFAQAMNQAAQAGQMMAQNPAMAMGMNGTKPDIIPAVRPADTMLNGTALCAVCFPAQKQTGLIAAGGSGWRPGQ